MGNRKECYTKKRRRNNNAVIFVICFLVVAFFLICFFVFLVSRISNTPVPNHHKRKLKGNYDHVHEHYPKGHTMRSCPFIRNYANDAADKGLPEYHGIPNIAEGRYVHPSDLPDQEFLDSLPNPRDISNLICKQPEDTDLHDHYTALVPFFGQFVDHNIILTLEDGKKPPIWINVTGDSFFDPNSTGLHMKMGQNKFLYDDDGYKYPVSGITAFMDSTVVLGATSDRNKYLRSYKHGELNLHHEQGKDGDYPRKNIYGLDNAPNAHDKNMFLCGDVRCTETSGLTSLHTVYLRLYQYIAKKITTKHYDLSDECVYQKSKHILIALLQKITYEEYLPSLLGHPLPDPPKYWRPDVDPRMFSEFGIAYRLHSLVPSLLHIYSPYTDNHVMDIELKESFWNPDLFLNVSASAVILGMIKSKAEKMDTFLVDDLRNELFANIGEKLDLCALNIQRSRHLGTPTYNQMRERLGLQKYTSWEEANFYDDIKDDLEGLYGDIDNLELWIGVNAEVPKYGNKLGKLLDTIITDQFVRMRDADPQFYTWSEDLTYEDLDFIKKTTFKDVLLYTTDIKEEYIPENPFLYNKQV